MAASNFTLMKRVRECLNSHAPDTGTRQRAHQALDELERREQQRAEARKRAAMHKKGVG